MANNFIFGSNCPTYTVTATSNAPDHTCTNLSNFTNLRRSWRSASTSQQTLDFTFSSSQSIVGVVVDDTNFTSITIGGTAPLLQLGSDDKVGRVAVGTTSAGCTITFANAYTNTPSCSIMIERAAAAPITDAVIVLSASAITITEGATDISSAIVNYNCIGLNE